MKRHLVTNVLLGPEEKKDQVQNPSGYLKAAIKRETPPAASFQGNAHDEGKVHRRASWLNANVFPDRPIDEEAIAMLKALGAARAMELFKDIEEKKEQVRNPSGYLKTAVAREPTGPPSPMRSQPAALGPEEKIYRRGSWLNAKVFADRPIDDEALEAVKSLGIQRAMELFKDVEEKQEKVANPSGYLKAAVAREGSAPAMSTYPTYRQAPSTEVEEEKIQKRVTWLTPGDWHGRSNQSFQFPVLAIGAMFGLGIARAFELLKEMERGQGLAASLLEGRSSWTAGRAIFVYALYRGEPKYGTVDSASWLNNNVFPDRPIDEEAIAAMSSLNVARAMELFKEVEEKAANLRNPGCYAGQAAQVRDLLRARLKAGVNDSATEEYIDQCIRQADVNSDGKIDIDEFVHLMVLHLPDARIAADTEFVTDQAQCLREWSQERAHRLLQIIVTTTLDRSAVQRWALCLLTTLGAGMLEGFLLVDLSHEKALNFVLRYAAEQLLPSVVWCTQDASLVCEAMGFSPEDLLKRLEGTAKASTLLAVGQCHAVRSVSAGFGLLGQLFQFAQITNNTFKHFKEKVRAGRDVPLSSGAEERVIRLCGDFSYATYATVSKNGRFHILPVLDSSNMPMLAERVTHGFKYPLFLSVPPNLWGQPDVWRPLLGAAVQPSWLLKGLTEQILCIEVDGTARHEILLFGKVRKIGIEQASNAFRGISFVCLRSLQQQGLDTSKVKLLRVYLGDSHELSSTGAGKRFTCRERFESRREADVLVDFHAPIVRRLRLWALDSATLVPVEDHEDALPTFCFETTSTERFQNLAHLMRDTAHVVDQVSAVKLCKTLGAPLPRLIHYPSTAETVNAAYALARPGEEFCDPTQTLVLCEREWGAKEIRKLNAGFKVLSAAEIIDDLLREVRQWARHGFTGPEIQAELDRRDLQTLKVVRSAMHAACSAEQKGESEVSGAMGLKGLGEIRDTIRLWVDV
ncbi:unnamed protein product [Durusdinium trenchii]|uniref:EF-hand domain-containing protein n=1 Tax=Durusdinium trenchii TaxID=1381693 RepID=A0ABP0PZ31_9DINO